MAQSSQGDGDFGLELGVESHVCLTIGAHDGNCRVPAGGARKCFVELPRNLVPGSHLDRFAPRRSGKLGHVHPLWRPEQPFELRLVESFGRRKELENPSAAVVDDHQHRGRHRLPATTDKRWRVV